MGLRTDEFIARANEILDKAPSFLGISFISYQKMTEIIDRLQAAIPEDVRDAGNILKRREDIIESAKYEAERIKNEALNERSRILSESELLRAVQQEGAVIREKLINECEEIKNKAYSDADSIRLQVSEEARRMQEGADSYAEQVLLKLEDNINKLNEMLEMQRTGIQKKQIPVGKILTGTTIAPIKAEENGNSKISPMNGILNTKTVQHSI